ncbi:hypothetical protein [Veronia pacifica]|uniref:hypothetical protein n=1 Tax=Veronia pacifica TaxID=1080227 RepID=UPI00158644FF|nr:hypothetical protein [Veronia pacifica]
MKENIQDAGMIDARDAKLMTNVDAGWLAFSLKRRADMEGNRYTGTTDSGARHVVDAA